MQSLMTGMGCLEVQYTFLFFLNKNQKKSKLTSLTPFPGVEREQTHFTLFTEYNM